MFDGTVAEVYDRHLSRILFEPFARRLSHALPESRTVLELACGTGACTRRLASLMQAGSSVVALDKSESMLAIAKQKAVGTHVIDWVRADAEHLPFDEAIFDVVLCGFGVMFFEDRLAALREMHRVLLPGGLLRYTVWASQSQNEWIQVVKAEMANCFPDVDPIWYDAPFACSDVDMSLNLLEDAGFPEVRLVPVRMPLRDVDPKSLARGFVQGNPGIRKLSAERQVDAGTLEDKLSLAFVRAFGSPIEATMRAFMYEAGALD